MEALPGTKIHLRDMKCELGLLERADGSARVIQGTTSVLCAVYGPAEVKVSKELADRATLEVVVKPDRGQSGPRERLMEQFIASTCDSLILTKRHPHTAISIILQVEKDDGALLSCLCHAACLALLESCIPMSSVFSALVCGFTDDGELITDPDELQEKRCVSLLSFVVEGTTMNIVTSQTQGTYTYEQLHQALIVTEEACRSVCAFYRQAVERRLSKELKH
ncbi:hypothetical protein EMCRGX_G032858 [Ephydatia muelleri]